MDESASQLQHETPEFLEVPVLWDDLPITAVHVNWSWPEFRIQTVCTVEGGTREVTQVPRKSSEDCEKTSDIGH